MVRKMKGGKMKKLVQVQEIEGEGLEAYYEYRFGNPTTTVGQGESK